MRRIKNNKAEAFIHNSGLKSIHLHEPTSGVGIFGLVARAGSRFDPPECEGLAHFVEHTIFKGTKKRSAWHILNRMERVGGELNAYTGKEYMVVYTIFPAGNESRAVELLSDLVFNSTFPESQLDKEKDVVAEEIDSYLDSPSDRVYDDFEDLLFAGTPLGHNILGSEKSLTKFDSAQCRSFLCNSFTGGNMSAFYSGPVSSGRIAGLLDRFFHPLCSIPQTKASILAEPPERKFDEIVIVPTHQANVVMGACPGNLIRRDRVSMALLSNMLGGPGMNSILNVSLREKRGLVYTVETSFNSIPDTTWFTVYFASDPAKSDKCRQLVREAIDRLASDSLSPCQLAAVKKQYAGQLVMGCENRENEATELAKFYLVHDRLITPAESVASVMAVSADDIRQAASRLASLSSLTLRP